MSVPVPPIRIVVADDHPVIRHGLINLFATEFDFRLVATCANGAECVRAIHDFKPDLALVDMSMPAMTGLDVLAALVAEKSPTRVVFFAGAPEDREIVAALNGGAYGFALKDTAPDALLVGLRQVAQGEKWFPAEVVEPARHRERAREAEYADVNFALTAREREVMLLIGRNLTNKETGKQLHLSEGTVKLHLHSIFRKLGLRNRTALAALAVKYRDTTGQIISRSRPMLGSQSAASDASLGPDGRPRPGGPQRPSS